MENVLFLVIQESCIKRPISDVKQKTEVIFIFRASVIKQKKKKKTKKETNLSRS